MLFYFLSSPHVDINIPVRVACVVLVYLSIYRSANRSMILQYKPSDGSLSGSPGIYCVFRK